MKPLRQTRFGGADAPVEQIGNCYATCIASLLDLDDPEQVPNFCANETRWFDDAVEWLFERGLLLLVWNGNPLIRSPYGDRGTLIASGQGPRGHRHSVLWRDGRLLHDPHPSDAGLLGDPDEFDMLVLTDATRLARWRAA